MSDASFPGSVKTWVDKQDNVDDVFAGDTNGAYAEIVAVETELMQAGYKKSVRAATTQNGDLATAYANGQVVDGVTLVTDDRILLKNQTSGAENGIYTVNASGAPTRTIDANSSAHMVAGLMVYIREGTVNAKGTWKLVTTGTITLGTTSLVFENEVAGHLADYVRQPAFAIDTGSANAYIITTDPAPTAYVDGMSAYITIGTTNTGASTIDWNGLAAKTIVTSKGAILTAGKLTAGGIVGVRYNATTGNFILQGEGGEYGDVTADKVVTGVTFGTEEGLAVGTYDKVATVGDKVMVSNYVMPVGISEGSELLNQYSFINSIVVDYTGLTLNNYEPQFIAFVSNSYLPTSKYKLKSSFTTTVIDFLTSSVYAYAFSNELATVDTKTYCVVSDSPQYIQCYSALNILLASYYISTTYTTSYSWSVLPGGVVSFRYGDYIYLRKIDGTINLTGALILGTQAQLGAPSNGKIIDGYLYLHLGTWKLVKIDLVTLSVVAETSDARIINRSFVNNNVTTDTFFYLWNSVAGKLYKVDKNTLEILVEGSVNLSGDMFVKDVGHPTAILAAGYSSSTSSTMRVYLLDKITLMQIATWYVDDSGSIPDGTYKFKGLDGGYDPVGGYFYSKGLVSCPSNNSYYAKWANHIFCPFSPILLTM